MSFKPTYEELSATLADRINRCAAVEAILFDMAAGKVDLPTREECRKLASKLGKPESVKYGKELKNERT